MSSDSAMGRSHFLFVTKYFSYLARARQGKYDVLLERLRQEADVTIVSQEEPLAEMGEIVKSPNVQFRLYRYLGYRLRRFYYRLKQGSYHSAPTGVVHSTARKGARAVLGRIRRILRNSFKRLGFFAFPDAYALSIPKGLRIAEKELLPQTSAIISSCYPFSNLYIGMKVKERHPEVPWIIEFRDPFANYPFDYRPRLHKALHCRHERRMLELCDEAWIYRGWFPEGLEYFHREYPQLKHKVIELPFGGFDARIFEGCASVRQSRNGETLTIRHAGNFYYGEYSPVNLLRAVGQLRREKRLTQPLRLSFYGGFDPKYMEVAQEEGVADLIEHADFVPYAEMGPVLCSADLLFWVSGRQQLYSDHLPAKVFDYLGSGVAILALLPQGKARAFAEEAGMEYIAETDDLVDIKRVVERALRDHRRGTLRESGRDGSRFSVQNAVEEATKRLLQSANGVAPT